MALPIRDRRSGQLLLEARAGSGRLLGAMFMAAMKDFPRNGINPRRVSIQLPG